MDAPSTFGERLAFARWWRAGVVRRESDAEFAALLGISAPALSQWREREDPVDVIKVEIVAELCEVPFEWMLRGERSRTPAPELFGRFLPAYRAWVDRGGLKKAKGKTKLIAVHDGFVRVAADADAAPNLRMGHSKTKDDERGSKGA